MPNALLGNPTEAIEKALGIKFNDKEKKAKVFSVTEIIIRTKGGVEIFNLY